MGNMRTVAFARVSSKAQEEEGYSLDAQLKLIRGYCRGKGLQIVTEFRIAETASKDEHRKVFRQMLVYLNKNNIAHLTVEKTDRLTRNFRDAIVVDDWLEADQQRRLHMVKERLQIHKYAGSDDKLMWNIFLSLAKKMTDALREEAMKGWAEKLAQGWMPSSPPPGYKTVTENGKRIHVVDEDTSILIRRAFQLYTEPGQTIETVADELRICGLTSRKGRPIARTMVAKVLDNPFYIGTIRFNSQLYQGAHEPIIDKKLFAAVQEKLHGNHVTKFKRHDPLFKSMLHCATCKGMITWQLQKGRYYGACQRHNEECRHHPTIREDRLETIVRAKLQELDEGNLGKKALRVVREALEASQQPYVGKHRLGVMKMIKGQIRRNESMADVMYEDKLSGVITEEKYATKFQEISATLNQLRDRLRKIEEIEGATKTDASTAEALVALYDSEPKTGKRIIVSKLFKLSIERGSVIIES